MVTTLRTDSTTRHAAARKVRLGAARITYTERAPSPRATDIRQEWAMLVDAVRMAIRFTPGIEVDENVSMAAIACGHGDSSLITQLRGVDKLAAVLMVAVPCAAGSQTRPPGPGGGVHVMVSEPAAVAEYFTAFSEALTGLADLTVARLATEPAAYQPSAPRPGAGPATSSTAIPESPSSGNLPLGWPRQRPIQCHGRRSCREEPS